MVSLQTLQPFNNVTWPPPCARYSFSAGFEHLLTQLTLLFFPRRDSSNKKEEQKHQRAPSDVIHHGSRQFSLTLNQQLSDSLWTKRQHYKLLHQVFTGLGCWTVLHCRQVNTAVVYPVVKKYKLHTYRKKPTLWQTCTIYCRYAHIKLESQRNPETFLLVKPKWLLSPRPWMSRFYDSTVKRHIFVTHTYTNTHTHTKAWQAQAHTSITDFPTIALYRQIKGISVRAVKPVTPPVICVRQSNSE